MRGIAWFHRLPLKGLYTLDPMMKHGSFPAFDFPERDRHLRIALGYVPRVRRRRRRRLLLHGPGTVVAATTR